MSHYDIKYDSKRRFASYWHQIREILDCHPGRVLEVGVGSGFLGRYLRGLNVDLVTVDNQKDLKPDVVADVRTLPFRDGEFDAVAAYEILEHLPYQDALRGLQELVRVSSKNVLISLPDATRVFYITCSIPFMGKFQKVWSVPIFPRAHQITKSGHHWEIGKRGYPLSRIKRDFVAAGLHLKKTYRVFENPNHRFFVFEKIGTHFKIRFRAENPYF